MSPENVNHFSKYGRSFQEKIFQSLMLDHRWAAQMAEVMTHEYFELKYLQYLCDRFFGFYIKYKNFPTMNLLVSIIRDELSEGNDGIAASSLQDITSSTFILSGLYFFPTLKAFIESYGPLNDKPC